VPRPTKQQIDDEIVEQASALFARHGFRDTSVQSIADAAGYSKTGLLHRFPSKEALWAAVVERCVGMCRQIADDVADLPVGPDRDRAVLTGLVDLAPAALPRRIRVVGALGALAVAGIALRDASPQDVRDHLIAAAYDTLGHAAHPQIPAARRAPARATD
jgi:AcrR family transcriptional regulator